MPRLDFFGAGGIRSEVARWFVALGYLGLLGFAGYAFGSPRLLAFTSLLGLVAVGYGIEWIHRTRRGEPMWTANRQEATSDPNETGANT